MQTRRLVAIAVFTALTVLGGLISVPIPFTQIELSFQTVIVMLAGALLDGRDGAIAVLVYIAMGLLGLPVFTRGGGIGYVFMPSFGYLLGFPVGAFITGRICAGGKSCTRGKMFAAALIGMIPVYVIGITYQVLILYYYTGIAWAAVIGGVPAVLVLFVKDAALCGLVSVVYPSLKRALRYSRGAESKPENIKRDLKHNSQ